jgi:Tol biopolymer transport system component
MKRIFNSILCALLFFALPVGAQTSALVSGSARPSATGGGGSYQPVLSADGRFVAFVSKANNLVTNDNLAPYLDVFLRDRVAERSTLVSVRADGAGGGDDNSVGPSVSADGRFVAFQSAASDLGLNDTNGLSDVFLRDMVAGTTLLISRELSGWTAAGRASTSPIISTNGRWVVFESAAANLVPNDTNGAVDVFLFDRLTGINSLVSLNADGNGSGAGASLSPAITPDGSRVAFVNYSSNTTPAVSHVYVRDLQAGTTTWASSNAPVELPGYLGALNPVLSANGSAVIFHAYNTNITNLYRFDLTSGTQALVSASAQAGSVPAPSADGRYVAYEATNVVFIWDAQSGASTPVSVDIGGLPAPSTAGPARPAVSADGAKVSFLSNARDLTAEPVNGVAQLYLRDLAAGSTTLLSGDANGASSGDLGAIVPVMSADGNVVAFESTSSTMVADDLNLAPDVFSRDMVSGTTALMSGRDGALPSVTGVAHATVYPNAISTDGRYVAYASLDNAQFPGDTNGVQDIFVRDLANGTVEPASVSSAGEFTNRFNSLDCVLSGDGRHVAYVMSTLPTPGSPLTAVFWRDLDTGETRPISEPSGSGGWAVSGAPTISADGRWVAFQTTKLASFFEPGISDSVAGGTSESDIILHDTLAGTNYVISRNSINPRFTDGRPSILPVLSPDGRWLAYLHHPGVAIGAPPPSTGNQLFVRDLHSNVATLVNDALPIPTADPAPWFDRGVTFSGDSRFLSFGFLGFAPVFVYDLLRQTSAVVCVSCRNPSVSTDGRYVVVETRAYNTPSDVVLYDRQTGLTNLLSAASGSLSGGNGRSYSPIISRDSRFVVFVSRATNIDPADSDPLPNLYVHDRVRGTTMALHAGVDFGLGNGPSYTPVMSADGRTLVFSSFASDLVSGDYNDRRDVFVVRLGSPDTDGDGLDDDWEVAFFNNLSRDGNGHFDHDGQSDRAEFLAGTDPTNTGSVLRALTVTPLSGTAVRVYWNAVAGRTYQVQYKDDLAAGWTTLPGQVTATFTTASKLDSGGAPLPAQRFYRVVLP